MVAAKKKTKIIISAICALFVLIMAGLIAGSFYFHNYVVDRNDKPFLQDSKYQQTETTAADMAAPSKYMAAADWLESQNLETWTITSDDGLKLTGYYLKALTPTDKTIIVAHGYSSKAKDMAIFAKFYSETLSYNVLMPDARGHGDSEGDYIGFGWPERLDYLQWIQKVIDLNGTDSQIALFGVSMGGATVMMTSGENLPEQVKAIVEDCGYSSVNEELGYQMKAVFNLPSFPLVNTTSILTDIEDGYNFYEASSVKQVAKDKLPVLFIHGSADTFVPIEMVYKVYNACKADKDILIVDGASHGMSYTTDQALYEARVTEFLLKYIN